MTLTRCGWMMFAGVILAMTSVGSTQAQMTTGPAHPQAPFCPVDYASPGPAPGPATPTPSPTCTCGDRHGLSRLRWHRTQCRRHQQAAWIGYPEEFNEWTLGRSLYANAQTQVSNGAAARMIFNEYDFVDGGKQLNIRGLDKLESIAAQLPTNFAPVVIERTPHTLGLDQGRRLEILNQLAGGPFPVPPERVVVGRPVSLGQRGRESIIVEQNRLGSVAAGGALGGGGGGGGTGVGPGSFDGSGLSGSTVGQGAR
jgi:hypothetical protein